MGTIESSWDVLRAGTVIPAHLLALDAQRRLDERRQRALSRYYLDAGVGGLAVGVHSTQFAIREHGLYPRVLELAMETARTWMPLGGVVLWPWWQGWRGAHSRPGKKQSWHAASAMTPDS